MVYVIARWFKHSGHSNSFMIDWEEEQWLPCNLHKHFKLRCSSFELNFEWRSRIHLKSNAFAIEMVCIGKVVFKMMRMSYDYPSNELKGRCNCRSPIAYTKVSHVECAALLNVLVSHCINKHTNTTLAHQFFVFGVKVIIFALFGRKNASTAKWLHISPCIGRIVCCRIESLPAGVLSTISQAIEFFFSVILFIWIRCEWKTIGWSGAVIVVVF